MKDWKTSILTVIPWMVLSVGLFLCLIRVTDFNDSNLSLMVGVGLLLSSVCIYVLSHVAKFLREHRSHDRASS